MLSMNHLIHVFAADGNAPPATGADLALFDPHAHHSGAEQLAELASDSHYTTVIAFSRPAEDVLAGPRPQPRLSRPIVSLSGSGSLRRSSASL